MSVLQSGLRVPFFSVAVSPARKQFNGAFPAQILAVGQLATGSTVAVNIAKQCFTPSDAAGYFGTGSDTHLMVKAILTSPVYDGTPVFGMAIADPTGSPTKATWAITPTITTAANGTWYLRIGGVLVSSSLLAGDAVTDIVPRMVAAINAIPDMPVVATATSTNSVVTLTQKIKGTAGNGVDVSANYLPAEEFPNWLTATIVPTAGTGALSYAGVFTAIGDSWYQWFVTSLPDDGSFASNLLTRFDPIHQIMGLHFSAVASAYGTVQTLGLTYNSAFLSILSIFGCPTTNAIAAGRFAAIVAAGFNGGPTKPLWGNSLGILPPRQADQFILEENDTLLYSGISIIKPIQGDTSLGRAITTYQEDGNGNADDSYLRVETLQAIMFIRWDLRAYFEFKYGNCNIAPDGTIGASNQIILTPSLAVSEMIARFKYWMTLGITQNLAGFMASVSANIDATDTDRMDLNLSPEFIKQFVVGAANLQFA